jgi:beta-galactosidase
MLLRFALRSLLCATGLLAIAAPAGAAPASPREKLLLDQDWRFRNGDPADAGTKFAYPERGYIAKIRIDEIPAAAKLEAERVDPVGINLGGDVSWVQPDFNDGDWRSLNLQHDWFVELPFVPENDRSAPDPQRNPRNSAQGSKDVDPSKGVNIGWYRRTFEVPQSDKGKILSVELDGVFRNSLVWLNGHCLGRHVSGYTGFAYDLTPYVNFGGKNVLVVRVDASYSTGWFYEGAGIYRHVWLVKTNPLHVARWGTFVTSELKGTDAELAIETTIRNEGTAAATGQLVSTIFDSTGKPVAEVSGELSSIPGGKEAIIRQKVAVKNAAPWSPDSPSMYRLVSRVEQGRAVADVYETPFGIRSIRFDGKDGGFLLNGKRVSIKGTNNHQDHAGVGVAVPDRLQWFRIEKLKELGSSAYRSSHNPPAQELLEACDHLGMLVMSENRNVGSNPEALADWHDLILQQRNHPSVFLWSFGNEEDEIQGDDRVGRPIAQAMVDSAHKLDPTRPVTAAMNRGWGRGFSQALDVMGYNYWRNGNIDLHHEDFPDQPSLGSEECSAFSTRGFYGESKLGHASSYDVLNDPGTYRDCAEDAMRYYAQRPFLAGYFTWTGFDYRGEPAPFGWPQISSNFGILDTCGFPKDTAFFYQAWWGGKPLLHVFPHWNWPGKEGQPIPVWAYTNGDEVELFLNGRSLGRKPVPRQSHAEWSVPYAPGTLSAVAYRDGKVLTKTKVETTGAPVALELTPDRTDLKGNGEDVSVITVSAKDSKGRPVPVADNLVKFHVEGGTIIGVGNGDPASHEADKASQRSLFNGLAQVIVQAPRKAGKITLKAEAEGVTPAEVKLNVDASGPRPSVP